MLSKNTIRDWILIAGLMALLYICLIARASAQDPVPPTSSVEGNLVTLNADIAWHHPDLKGVEIVQGVPLSHPSVVASSNGVDPIVLRMPPGTHEITALGYPLDRMKPLRAVAVLTETVDSPTRQQEINALYATYLSTRDKIIAMSPSTAEAITAIIAYAQGKD